MKGPKRRRDLWQLHLPLALALVVCSTATVIEFTRATDGVGRAWAYTFQWPLFGIFAIWMWVRYRREGRAGEGDRTGARRNPFAGIVEQWKDRVADAERAADAQDDDPDLIAWRRHVADLRDVDLTEAKRTPITRREDVEPG